MQIFKLNFLFVVASAILMTACYDDDDRRRAVSSSEVSTGRVYATFQVVADGSDEVYAQAQLTRGLPPRDSDDTETFVRLSDGDQLWFSTGENIDAIDFSGDLYTGLEGLSETQVQFSASRFQRETYSFIFDRLIINEFGEWYSARLPQNIEGRFRVSWLRDDGVSASDSFITISAPFDIISPGSGASYSRSMDDILVEWSNPDPSANVEISANTTCSDLMFDSFSETLENDSGSYTIPAGTLNSDELIGSCSTTLSIRKIRRGEFDAKYLGGTADGYQIRRVVLQSDS